MPNITNLHSCFNGMVSRLEKAMANVDEGAVAERSIEKKAYYKIAEHHLKEAKKFNGVLGAEMNALIEEMRTVIKPPKEIPADAVCRKDGCRFWSKTTNTPIEAMTDHRNTTSQGHWGWEHSLGCPFHRLNVSSKTAEVPKSVPSS